MAEGIDHSNQRPVQEIVHYFTEKSSENQSRGCQPEHNNSKIARTGNVRVEMTADATPAARSQRMRDKAEAELRLDQAWGNQQCAQIIVYNSKQEEVGEIRMQRSQPKVFMRAYNYQIKCLEEKTAL